MPESRRFFYFYVLTLRERLSTFSAMSHDKAVKTAFSAPESLVLMAQDVAAAEYKSFSAYITSLVVVDLRKRGFLAPQMDNERLRVAVEEAVRIHGTEMVVERLSELLVQKEVVHG